MSTLNRILNRSRRPEGDPAHAGRLDVSGGSSTRFVRIADGFRRRGRYQDAIAVCLEGLANHPRYVSGHVALARAYQFSGDIPNAVAAYERVVALAPDNIAGHLGLAEVYETQHRFCEAAQHLRVAIQLGEDGTDVRTWLDRVVQLSEPGCRVDALIRALGPGVGVVDVLRKKIAVLQAYREGVARRVGGGEGGGSDGG